jgi:uncharacterized protein YcaQ
VTDRLALSAVAHRRAVLGLQGLWPGRRFGGASGVADALRAMHALQLDPLNAAARSQDIALYGRVLGYAPEQLGAAAYERREAFDYGGWLHLLPIETFRFWRTTMKREKRKPHVAEFRARHPRAMREVMRALRTNGAMSNRAFEGRALGAWSYRGRKDSAVALHLLWLLGEVMIVRRGRSGASGRDGDGGFDRVYDLRERVLPAEHEGVASEREADAFTARHVVALHGVMRERAWRRAWGLRVGLDVAAERGARVLAGVVARGEVVRVRVEGSDEPWVALPETLPLLDDVAAGRVPAAWKPLGASTGEEATLLAPLEISTARRRALRLFGFDYLWEVYKPAQRRRWGYYTLPVLYEDRLVARLDPKLDRSTGTLAVLGFWLEDGFAPHAAFADALAAGLARFARMCGATRVDVRRMRPMRLSAHLKREIAARLA